MSTHDDFLTALAEDRVISATKLFREATGASLTNSKEIVVKFRAEFDRVKVTREQKLARETVEWIHYCLENPLLSDTEKITRIVTTAKLSGFESEIQ